MQEKELRKVLGAELSPSRVLDAKMEEAYTMIRNTKAGQTNRKNPVMRRVLVGIGSVAAVFAVMVTFCVMNPVMASEIPILGGIFAKLSDLFSFGQLPAEDTVILYQGNEDTSADNSAEGTGGSAANTNAYQKTSGDITITLTEEYATNQAVFIGVNVRNVREFPSMTLYMDGTQNLAVETAEKYSFRDDIVYASRHIEGKFTDAYTFDGILRIDYSDINKDDRKYQQVLEEAGITEENIKESGNEKFWITDANIAQYIEEYEIPETFTMKLDISNIVGDLAEPIPVESAKSGEEQEYSQHPNKYKNWWQEGSWSYDLAITQKDSASRVIEVNQTNEAGIGLKSIELSAVEMTLNTIEGADTIAVALDAEGNKIENGSSNMYELAITGHDISKVYLYICDWDEYMDEIKGYGVPGNNLDRSFQEVLEERALFKTVVETGVDD